MAQMLRHVLEVVGVDDRSAFAVHSLKVTLLAWTGQAAALEKDQRRNQGHHKVDVAELYGRDETLAALRVQLKVLEALAQGWKPRMAQERGAAMPLIEPPCDIEIPGGIGVEYTWLKPWDEQTRAPTTTMPTARDANVRVLDRGTPTTMSPVSSDDEGDVQVIEPQSEQASSVACAGGRIQHKRQKTCAGTERLITRAIESNLFFERKRQERSRSRGR